MDEKPLENLYSEWATMDYKLFNFFNATFWQKLEKIDDLDLKVQSYSNFVHTVYDFCSTAKIFFPMAFRSTSASPLENPASFWERSITCSW